MVWLCDKNIPGANTIRQKGVRQRNLVTKLNDGAVLKLKEKPAGEIYYEVAGEIYRQTYPRILIRHRQQEKQ